MIENERIITYLATLEREKENYLNEIECIALRDDVPIIKRQTQNLLRFLLSLQQPRKILEIGSAVGFSALYMREYSNNNTTITTIEKVPQRIQAAKENFATYDNNHRIQLLEGDAMIRLEELVHQEESFDFIFMDAAKGQYSNFLRSVCQLITPGGLLVTDNVLQDGDIIESRFAVTRRDRTIHGRMREYLKTLTNEKEWESLVLPIGDGVALSIRK